MQCDESSDDVEYIPTNSFASNSASSQRGKKRSKIFFIFDEMLHDLDLRPNVKRRRHFHFFELSGTKNIRNDGHQKDTERIINFYKCIFERRYVKKDLEISFENVYINIGSYQFYSESKEVILSNDGLIFFVPAFKSDKKLFILSIELDEIVKVLIHSSDTNPMILFMTTDKIANFIREELCMDNPDEPYFDPLSSELKHQHIIISPACMSDACKDHIKLLFSNKIVIEMDETEADEFLAPAIEPLENQQSDEYIYAYSHLEVQIFYFRTVRVGNYEYAKKGVFSMSTRQLTFNILSLKHDSSNITITINMDEIQKILIRFSGILPVMFFYISNNASIMVNRMMGMIYPLGTFWINPIKDSYHNKITIFPEEISERYSVIKALMKQGKIRILQEEEADDILAITIVSPERVKTIYNIYLVFEVIKSNISNYSHIKRKEFVISFKGIGLYYEGINISIEYNEVIKILYYVSTQFVILQLMIETNAEEQIKATLQKQHCYENYNCSDHSNQILNGIVISLVTPISEKKISELQTLLREMSFAESMSYERALRIDSFIN